jgi:hypothetical protein
VDRFFFFCTRAFGVVFDLATVAVVPGEARPRAGVFSAARVRCA